MAQRAPKRQEAQGNLPPYLPLFSGLGLLFRDGQRAALFAIC